MLKYRRIAAFLISFFFFCPNDAFAHRAGEYVPLNASVTADSLMGAESIDLENYQFEGSNVTDTNIHDSGTDFIGYGETRYPVAVVSAGEITDVPNDLAQDIFQFEQQLLVEGSEIYRLFQKYQSENLTPEQQTRFNSAWQDVVNGYSETIARLDEGINPGETARQRLSGKTIQDVLQHIPELSVTGGLTVHVDANTDPTSSEERRRNIFALMSSIGRENWNRAQEAAESIRTLMSGHSFTDTQIVGRTDLYQPAYQYEGNVLTLQITSRGGMSTSGGESLISQYSHNDEGGLECHTVSSTEEARQYHGPYNSPIDGSDALYQSPLQAKRL